ncbi:hypothetical protein ACPA9J_19020 [Pseudomonas aeruginosa]
MTLRRFQRRARRALRRCHRGRASGWASGNAAHRRPVHQQHPIARADAGRRPALHGARMAELAVRAQLKLREHEQSPLVAIQEQRVAQGPAAVRQPVRVRERLSVEVSVLDRAQSLNASSDSGRPTPTSR